MDIDIWRMELVLLLQRGIWGIVLGRRSWLVVVILVNVSIDREGIIVVEMLILYYSARSSLRLPFHQPRSYSNAVVATRRLSTSYRLVAPFLEAS